MSDNTIYIKLKYTFQQNLKELASGDAHDMESMRKLESLFNGDVFVVRKQHTVRLGLVGSGYAYLFLNAAGDYIRLYVRSRHGSIWYDTYPDLYDLTNLLEHLQDKRALSALIEMVDLLLDDESEQPDDDTPSKHFAKVSQLQLNHTGQGYDVQVKMN